MIKPLATSIITLLSGLLIPPSIARPTPDVNLRLNEAFVMRIKTLPGPQMDVEQAISKVEDMLFKKTSSPGDLTFPEDRYTIREENAPVIARLGEAPAGYEVRAWERGFSADPQPLLKSGTFQLLYGILIWLRQWRDEGWVQPAMFSSVWRDERLAGGRLVTDGTLGIAPRTGSQQNQTALSVDLQGQNNSTITEFATSRKFRRSCNVNAKIRCKDNTTFPSTTLGNNTLYQPMSNSSLLVGIKPNDPWTISEDNMDGVLNQTLSNFRSQYFRREAFREVMIDCRLKYVFKFIRENQDWMQNEIEENPMVCGGENQPQIVIYNDEIEFGHVWFFTNAIWTFWGDFQGAGERWIPSVDFRADENYEHDGEDMHEIFTGFIGSRLPQ